MHANTVTPVNFDERQIFGLTLERNYLYHYLSCHFFSYNKHINQSMNSLNVALRYKQKNQSAFRVHFYLKNVYYNNEYKLTAFLQETANRISKVVEVSIIQICGSVKKMVELSVGLKSDNQAAAFMESHKKIFLPGEYGKVVQHQLIYSDFFKTYVKHSQSKQTIAVNSNGVDQKKEELRDQTNSPVRSQNRKKHSEQDSMLKRLEMDSQKHFTLFIFGIPLEFKQREIVSALSQKGIRTKYCEWKYKEDMEFIQIELYQAITEKQISAIDLRLQKYPLLVMPKVHEEFINTIIMRLQVQLNFQKDIDEIEFMKRADQVGGVLLMVKDEFYGPRKYNLTFNTVDNLVRFQQIVETHYKSCKITKPRYIVRLCRLEKSFTFAQMIDNMYYYELQLKKTKGVYPESQY